MIIGKDFLQPPQTIWFIRFSNYYAELFGTMYLGDYCVAIFEDTVIPATNSKAFRSFHQRSETENFKVARMLRLDPPPRGD